MIDHAIRMAIVQVLVVISALIMVYVIFKNLKSYSYEKKFASYSLLSDKDEEVTLYEHIHNLIFGLIYSISKVISKSIIIKKHSTKYDNDAKVDSRIRDGLDYISIKILTGLSASILVMTSFLFRYLKFDVFKVLLAFVVGYLIPNIFILSSRSKRKKKVQDDLLKAVMIMNNSFKSGRNIMQAINTVVEELDGPIADEFKKISLDISYGLSIDTVFNRFYNRVGLEDAKYIASSLTLLNKTGGNIIKVFSMIEQSFYEKKKLQNELKSLTASSVFVFRVLVLLPIIFVTLITILNKDYFKPLFSSIFGVFIFMIILALYVLYILVIKKVLEVRT